MTKLKKLNIPCVRCEGTGLYRWKGPKRFLYYTCSGCEGRGYNEQIFTVMVARKLRAILSTTKIYTSFKTTEVEDEDAVEYKDWLLGAREKEGVKK